MSNEPRFRKWVLFDPATGAIRAQGGGYGNAELDGFAYAELGDDEDVNAITANNRVDLASLKQRDGLPPIIAILTTKLDA